MRRCILPVLLLVLSGNTTMAVTLPSRAEVFFDYLKKTASETLQFNKETTDAWYESFNNLQIEQNLQNSLEKVKSLFDAPETDDGSAKKTMNRQFLESLGRLKVGSSGKTLDEYAREALQQIRPDLRETDFFQNPARTLSYFLMLDPRGFTENIRIIKGPLGDPMTIKEAYQYYTRTDPEKATKILNMLESLQKLSDPAADQNQMQVIIESIGQTIELLNQTEPQTGP